MPLLSKAFVVTNYKRPEIAGKTLRAFCILSYISIYRLPKMLSCHIGKAKDFPRKPPGNKFYLELNLPFYLKTRFA